MVDICCQRFWSTSRWRTSDYSKEAASLRLLENFVSSYLPHLSNWGGNTEKYGYFHHWLHIKRLFSNVKRTRKILYGHKVIKSNTRLNDVPQISHVIASMTQTTQPYFRRTQLLVTVNAELGGSGTQTNFCAASRSHKELIQ